MTYRKKWVVLESRSGQTLKQVEWKTGFHPDAVFHSKKMTKAEIYSELDKFNPADTVVTLIGYLHVVPKAICTKYKSMYNVHPAPIDLPEVTMADGTVLNTDWLKGLDPIERFFKWVDECDNTNLCGFSYGSVLHHVVPEVDAGAIIDSEHFMCGSLEECYEKSFWSNVDLWTRFLKDNLPKKQKMGNSKGPSGDGGGPTNKMAIAA